MIRNPVKLGNIDTMSDNRHLYTPSVYYPMSEPVSRESLAERTRIYIDAHPSIKDCVAKGLINYSSLARMIMKDLEVENEEAVMIACRRYASKLSVTTDHELSILSILKDSRLEMRTKTCIVTAKNDWTVLHKMDNLFKDMWNENSIMQCVQSASAVTIIADRMLKDRIIDTWRQKFQPQGTPGMENGLPQPQGGFAMTAPEAGAEIAPGGAALSAPMAQPQVIPEGAFL